MKNLKTLQAHFGWLVLAQYLLAIVLGVTGASVLVTAVLGIGITVSTVYWWYSGAPQRIWDNFLPRVASNEITTHWRTVIVTGFLLFLVWGTVSITKFVHGISVVDGHVEMRCWRSVWGIASQPLTTETVLWIDGDRFNCQRVSD